MSDDPNRMLNDLCGWIDDGAASEGGSHQPTDSTDPVAVANQLMMHGLLADRADRQEDGEHRIDSVLEAIRNEGAESNSPLPVNRLTNPWLVLALSACLLMATAIAFWNSSKGKQNIAGTDPSTLREKSFASIVQLVDAEFADAKQLQAGSRLSAGTIDLRAGFLRLQFDDGVDVTLQGPAKYQLIRPAHTKLSSGLLTANVPPGAEGFTVVTPHAEVVDLGTSFGINLQEDETSSVSVFDGEVEVGLPGAQKKQLLKEGQAVRVGAAQTIESIPLDPEPFTKVWPISSGIHRSTEAFSFVPPWPPQFRYIQSDADIFVAPEGYGTTLSDPLRVNISASGRYTTEAELTPDEIAAGTRVRSFMMFFHPEKLPPLRLRKSISGSMTFDSEILGVIVLNEELEATARRFARMGPRDVRKGHQLELTGQDDGDVITLSEDRRTVTVQLTTPARFSEFLRVIVDASQPAITTVDE